MWWITLLLLLSVIWALAYWQVGAVTWAAVVVAGLLWLTLSAVLHPLVLVPLWLVGGLLVMVLGVPAVRSRWITGPLLQQFRRVMPPMSDTEKEALDAGTVWWDAELFSGRPNWSKLLSTPKAGLSAEEQAFLEGPVERLCELADDWRITHEDQDLSDESWDYIRRERFFGMIIPKKYGGLGFSAYAHSQVVMKLASRSVTTAVTVMVPNSLGPGELLLRYGTQTQKDYYLPRLAAGEEIPCFALTGPTAGSDAGAIPDRGVVCHGDWQGKKVLGVQLSWDKRYITLGPVATLIGLAFKLYDPDHLLGDQTERGITLALIPRETPGVQIGARHVPLDIPFQNGPNQGEDVFIPISQLIGGEQYIGQGWRMLMECLAEGRGVSLPALSVGAGKTACRYTGAYAAVRRQFGMRIGDFEGVQEALARIAGLTYQMDAARRLTLAALDLGERPSVVSAIIKYHLTEHYRQVINDAMDVQGGSGICLGPSNLIGRAYQAIPIAITVEGANILTRSMIIFGQGAVRCHPWVLREMEAAQDPVMERALLAFDHALFGHVGFIIRNMARSLFLGLTRGRLTLSPVDGPTRRYFQQLAWMSTVFALCADAAMITLGGALKRKERLSARLGDVLSELYLMSAVLKRFEDDGRPEADLPLLRWSCDRSLYRMQESLQSLLANLPMRPLAWLLRVFIFPSGRPYAEPDDRLSAAAAAILLTPSAARDRLVEGIYSPADSATPQGRLEQAFMLSAEVVAIEKTLRQARRAGAITRGPLVDMMQQARESGLISEEQRAALDRMDKLRRQVIAVDSFSDYGQQRLRAAASDKPAVRANQ